jgi:hypothetical protein
VQAGLWSDEHFTVDGTLIEAWASLKSFRPKDTPPSDSGSGRNPEADFHGERRLNQTYASTTDPEVRLFRKGKGKEAQLYFMGYLLMENRHGLIIRSRLTGASGTAERDTAECLVGEVPGRHRITVGGDKTYDIREFSNPCVPSKPGRMWPRIPRGVPRLSTAEPPAIRATPPVNVCARAWQKSLAGSKPWRISGNLVTEAQNGWVGCSPSPPRLTTWCESAT